MSQKYESIEDFTPAFRATFINAVKPNNYGDRPKYDLRCLIPQTDDLSWFSNNVDKVRTMNQLPPCEAPQFKDGNTQHTKDTGEIYDGHANHWYIGMRSSDSDGEPQPFGIIDMQGNPAEAKDLYNGIWLQACYRLFPYNHPSYGLKILMRVDHLKIVGHDTPFSGGKGGPVSTNKVFGNAAPVAVPAHVSAQAPGAQAPQAQAAAPGQPQTGMPAPQVPQVPGMAPTPQAHVAAFNQPVAPAPIVEPGPRSVVTMGPNAQNFTYEQWQGTGQTDDQLRAAGIIL